MLNPIFPDAVLLLLRCNHTLWGMKIIPVWALLPHRPGNKINLQSRDQPLSIQFEIITNISSSQQNDVRKILQNICEQEKSYSLSKSSFSVLLLLISTLSLKLKLQLLFCSELPISPYIFHQPKYWAYLKVIFRVSSALKSFYHLAHLVCQILTFLHFYIFTFLHFYILKRKKTIQIWMKQTCM